MTVETLLTQKPLLGIKSFEYLYRILPERIALEFGVAPLAVEDEYLVVAAQHELPDGVISSLERLTRFPIKAVHCSYNQVRQFQARVYHDMDAFPPALPIDFIFEKLSIHISKDEISAITADSDNLRFNPSTLLKQRKITARQWLQLVSLIDYIPNKYQIQATPINYLLEFLDIDPAFLREYESLTPLWWVNGTLFLGLSDLEHFNAITDKAGEWPFRTAYVAIPRELNHKLRSSYTKNEIFSRPVREERIAENLYNKGYLSGSELQASLTLKRKTGITLAEALFSENS